MGRLGCRVIHLYVDGAALMQFKNGLNILLLLHGESLCWGRFLFINATQVDNNPKQSQDGAVADRSPSVAVASLKVFLDYFKRLM